MRWHHACTDAARGTTRLIHTPRFLLLASCLAAGAASAEGPARLSTRHVVTIHDHRFSPERLDVQPGDTVAFLNEDAELDYVYENSLAWGMELPSSMRRPVEVVVTGRARALAFQSARWPGHPLRVAIARVETLTASAGRATAPRALRPSCRAAGGSARACGAAPASASRPP